MPAGFYNTADDAFKRSHPLSRSIKLLGNDDAPFLHAIPHFAPELSTFASLSQGVTWAWAEKSQGAKQKNKHLEGGNPAQVEHFTHNSLTNHFQISKTNFGITRTAKKQNGLSNLPYQSQQSHTALMEDVNFSLVKSTAAVQRTKNVEGESMGLYGLFTANTEIDAGGADINRDLLEAICVEGKKKGVNFTHFIVNDKQAGKINKLFEGTYRTNYGLSKFEGTDITTIGNVRGLKRNINRLYEPLVEDSDIILIDINSVGLIIFDEQMDHELQEASDKDQYQHLMEWSFYFEHPYVAWRLKNLKAN